MEFFFEIFDASLPRHGPGDDASTQKALDILLGEEAGRKALRILDLGCGTGPQTIQLARRLEGRILALDFHQPFLDELRRRAEAAGVSEKIETRCADMRKLDLPAESFDLIWSEGALFAMGFREGLKACREMLVPGGFFGATELLWFRDDPPQECRRFLEHEYPAITDLDSNLAAFEAAGLKIVGHFSLPKFAWAENYLRPLAKRVASMREKYGGDPDRLPLIELIERENEIYGKYSDYYGYEFFLAKREEG